MTKHSIFLFIYLQSGNPISRVLDREHKNRLNSVSHQACGAKRYGTSLHFDLSERSNHSSICTGSRKNTSFLTGTLIDQWNIGIFPDGPITGEMGGATVQPASEEEVFLVAILDVRTDCLRRRIDFFFNLEKLLVTSVQQRFTGAFGLGKSILTKKNPGKRAAVWERWCISVAPPLSVSALSPFQTECLPHQTALPVGSCSCRLWQLVVRVFAR